MPGNLSFDELKTLVSDGRIDTVIAAQADMQGRLMGKRIHAAHFIDSAWEEVHSCNYLLATDMEMFTVPGYKATSWQAGYGDYTMKPDLQTLRLVPWLEATALVLCDVLDHHGSEQIAHAPRTILAQQLSRASDLGFGCLAATELEFFLFTQSYERAHKRDYRGLTPVSPYNEDYHIFQTTKEEQVMRAVRNGLYQAGIPVESTKGEAEAGQEEINIRYASALETADNHVIAKNAIKEIAWQQGYAATFMAKYSHKAAGSSCHIHQSLTQEGEASAFFDPASDPEYGMSAIMKMYLAGLIKYSADITWFLAPYVNSYKRFVAATFAPTKAVWSVDNRTAGYRIAGASSKAVRIECRIGGADLNPYLALAAQLAAGLAGISEKLTLEEQFAGDAYTSEKARPIARTLRDATAMLDRSDMLRSAFGDEVIDHYVRAAAWEQEDFDSKVTDYELSRGFERS